MALDDRDFMHRRRAAPTPWERHLRPRHEKTSWRTPLVFWLVLLFAMYQGAGHWLQGRDAAQSAAVRPQRGAAAPASDEPIAALPAPRPAPFSAASRSAAAPHSSAQQQQSVTKCVSGDGRTSYSDGPCPSGSRAAAVSVQPGLNLADGLSAAARTASQQANRDLVAQQQQQLQLQLQWQAQRAASHAEAVAGECAQLEALVRWLDTAARRPLPGHEQDRLRSERKLARDRQFALGCA